MTKIQRFIKAVEKMAKKIGAEPIENSVLSYKFKVDTKVGPYMFGLHHNRDEKRVKVYSIFGRFDDVDKAKEVCDCNPYSGKHNFHYFNANHCLDFFQDFLEDVTGKDMGMRKEI